VTVQADRPEASGFSKVTSLRKEQQELWAKKEMPSEASPKPGRVVPGGAYLRRPIRDSFPNALDVLAGAVHCIAAGYRKKQQGNGKGPYYDSFHQFSFVLGFGPCFQSAIQWFSPLYG
jgi:hypothetical protein